MQKDKNTILAIAFLVTLTEAIAVIVASKILGTIDFYFIESLVILLIPMFLFNLFIVFKTSIYDVYLDCFKKNKK